MSFPLSAETLITIISFIAAIAYQSAVLKRNVEIINERMSRLEENSNIITQLLVASEAKRVRLANVEARVEIIEKRYFDIFITNSLFELHQKIPKE